MAIQFMRMDEEFVQTHGQFISGLVEKYYDIIKKSADFVMQIKKEHNESISVTVFLDYPMYERFHPILELRVSPMDEKVGFDFYWNGDETGMISFDEIPCWNMKDEEEAAKIRERLQNQEQYSNQDKCFSGNEEFQDPKQFRGHGRIDP